jgi:hypothetical protein
MLVDPFGLSASLQKMSYVRVGGRGDRLSDRHAVVNTIGRDDATAASVTLARMTQPPGPWQQQPPIVPGTPPGPYLPPSPQRPVPPTKLAYSPSSKALAWVGGIAIVMSLGIAGAGGLANSGKPVSADVATVTTTVTITAPAVASSATTTQPAATKPPPPPAPTIEDGVWTVGTDFPAGKYRVKENVQDTCYWEITKSGTNGSSIVENDIVTGGRPTVTLRKGQDFKSQDCGIWVKIG